MENQTATTTNIIPVVNSQLTLESAVNDLRKRSADWERGALASSNAELYGLLQASYAVFKACAVNTKLTSGVDEVLKSFNIKCSKDTSLGLKVVRLAFATAANWKKHQYRHFAYARVLDLAHEKAIAVANLVDFIIDAGGIDEIRRGKGTAQTAASGPTKEQLSQLAKTTLGNKPLQSSAVKIALIDNFKPHTGNAFSLALVRDNQDGTGQVVYGLNDVVLVDRALEIAGSALMKAEQDRVLDILLNGNKAQVEDSMAEAAAILQTAMKPEVFLPEAAIGLNAATEQQAMTA